MNTGRCLVMFLLAGILVFQALPVSAQSNTTGSVRGLVTGPDGAPLPGTTVIAISDALVGGRLPVVANERGIYRFPSLPPGEYSFEASLPGFRAVRQQGIQVHIGDSLVTDIQLRSLEVSDEIVVVAQTAQVSTVDNSVARNLDSGYLERQPLPREANQLMNYLPGINDSLAFGATQEASNSYSLDGVNVSDPASGEHWILPNMDWIEEVQVAGLGAPAEYGGFTGAMFNMVTRSGGNELHGDAALYFTGGGLSASNTPEGFAGARKTDRYLDASVSLGGPLVRDKLWYFVSGEEVREDIDPYFEAAAPQSERGQEETQLSRYLGKLTYQATTNRRLVFLLDYDGKKVEHRGIGDYVLESASQKQDSPNLSYNVTMENVLNDNNFLAVKLTGFVGRDDRLPYHGDVPGREDADSGLEWQNYRYTHLQFKRRTTLDVSWNLFADSLLTKDDSHDFKFGMTYETATHNEKRTRNGGFTYYDDSYYCDSLEDYFSDPFCAVYSSDWGNEIFLDSVQRNLDIYAQDSWRLDRLTVNAGLRYSSYQGGFNSGSDDVYSVDMVAPRIGFAWDVTGDSSTALKAHYGRYYEGMFAYFYDREESGHVFTPLQYLDYNFDTDQFDIPAGGSTNSAVLDPNIEHPYVDQYLLTLEHQLTDTTLIGFDYIHRETRNIVAMVNTTDDYDNQVAPDNPLTGGDLPFYDLLSPQEFVITNPSGAYRDYDSVVARFERRYSDGWSLRGSLVWADLKGNTFKANGYVPEWEDANGQTNADGTLPGFSRWELKLSGSVDLPWDMMASAYYQYRSGEYWTPTVEIRGLYYNGRQTAFLEPRGSEQLDDRSLLDLHLEKRLALNDRVTLRLMVDVFNTFNSDTVTAVSERWGTYYYDWQNHPEGSEWVPRSSFGSPLEIERPREIRLGAKLSF